MASQLLDKIINDTTLKFGGRESLITRVANMTNPANVTFQLPPPDELDGLMASMQVISMGQKERIFWILLFSLMVLVAAGGNIIVIHIVSTNKEMKSVTNYFLVNLSLADTMVSTLNVIFNFLAMLNSHWPFGSIYCKISNFIAILSISASVFTLTAISCDRYTAIIHPLRPRMSHRHAIAWILLIWTLSSALASPNLIYSVLVEDRLVNDHLALTCTMAWPDGRYPLSSYDHMYNIIILVVTYLVPILTMAALYYKVGKELWGHQAIGEDVEKQARTVMAKRKIVKMMIVVVTIFALCWLPYHAFFIVNYYLPTLFQDGPLLHQRLYLIMYWLAMSNSMYNPIIIYFMNSKFRHEFKRVLEMICCCRTYVMPPAKVESTIQGGITRIGNNNYTGRRPECGSAGSHQISSSPEAFASETSRCKSSNRLSQSWLHFGRGYHRDRQSPIGNKTIEVIVTNPSVCEDNERGGVPATNREQEPFIKVPDERAEQSGGDKPANEHTCDKKHQRDRHNSIAKRSQIRGTELGGNERRSSCEVNNHDKVWI